MLPIGHHEDVNGGKHAARHQGCRQKKPPSIGHQGGNGKEHHECRSKPPRFRMVRCIEPGHREDHRPGGNDQSQGRPSPPGQKGVRTRAVGGDVVRRVRREGHKEDGDEGEGPSEGGGLTGSG